MRGEDVDGLEADLRAAREPWWEYVFLPDELPTGAEAETARAVLAKEMFFDPEPTFSAVRVPTLLFYGDDDSWTPVEASTETWRRARGDDVEIAVLPETGHEPTHANGAISDAYEQKLIEWPAARSAAPRQPS